MCALRGLLQGPVVAAHDLLPQTYDYHQQYLFKVPNGYCGLGGTGLSRPVGLTSGEA
jgi:peptide methionine sulfoxide reductase MsrA